MKILYMAKAFPPETGGVETYSEQVAMAYARAGHEVTVVTAYRGSPGIERRGDLTIINVGQKRRQAAIFIRMLVQLWALRTHSFDMVHCTTWRVALPVLLLRRALPMVLTVHGREVFVVPSPLKPLMRMVLLHANYIPVVSQPILDKVERDLGVELPQAFANWNGISFEGESATETVKPEGTVQIFCMCRLVERKNLHGAIRAVKALADRGHDIYFRIAGSGEEMERLAALIDDLGAHSNIVLLGRVRDEEIEPLYRSSHIFLHPQIATFSGGDLEGFGLTIADGMAFGCVPVAGASGGPLDFIIDGETGLLVNGNDIDAIEIALERLVTDSVYRAQLARTARCFARSMLTWDTHVQKILDRL